MPKNLRKRREKLWKEKKGKCYWCGVETDLPPRGVSHIRLPAITATIDHLRTRFDSSRQSPNNSNEERLVLACLECNAIRGRLNEIIQQDLTIPKVTIYIHGN